MVDRAADVADDGITLIEGDLLEGEWVERRAAGPGGGLLPGLVASYEQHGFERGYRRAVSDLLSSLLWVTEEFLRSQPQPEGSEPPAPSPDDVRRVLYRFEAKLEQHIHALAPDAGYVSDGLGI